MIRSGFVEAVRRANRETAMWVERFAEHEERG